VYIKFDEIDYRSVTRSKKVEKTLTYCIYVCAVSRSSKLIKSFEFPLSTLSQQTSKTSYLTKLKDSKFFEEGNKT